MLRHLTSTEDRVAGPVRRPSLLFCRLHRATLWAIIFVVVLAVPMGARASGNLDARDGVVIRLYELDPDRLAVIAERVDLWTVRHRDGYAVAHVTPAELDALRAAGHRVEIDAARTAEIRRPWRPLPGQEAGIPGFPCYRTVDETYVDLAELATEHPGLAQWVDFGDSWEKLNGPAQGDDLFELVLTNADVEGPKAPFILIAAMHARELATAELVARFAEQLVGDHGTDPEATWILDHTEIHVVAHLNPDGRKRVEAGQSLWRKNADSDFCSVQPLNLGVDLNRNSTFQWGGSGSSGMECSEIYRGPTPASEPETAGIEALMAAVLPDQRGEGLGDAAPDTATGLVISVHSAGELVLYPWEHTWTNAPNAEGLATLGRKFGYLNDYQVCQDSTLR